MRAAILNGAAAGSADGAAAGALLDVLGGRGWECESFQLDSLRIGHCTGCFNCWQRTPGRCSQRDDAEAVLKAAIRCDLLAYVSPVLWGSWSAAMKKMIERSIPILLPFFTEFQGETHHEMRYARRPRFLAVGISDAPGGADAGIFRELVTRNLLNFRSPSAGIVILDRNRPPEHGMLIGECLDEVMGARV